VIDAMVDPHEPPMPPKVSVDQAVKLATSLARGTPDALKIALTIAPIGSGRSSDLLLHSGSLPRPSPPYVLDLG
jgi:hypothetical protein